MRAEASLALLLVAGCTGEREPAAPDAAVVETLAEVLLAESRATAAGADVDSARAAALTVHGADTNDLEGWLESAAANPEDGSALWTAVVQLLEAERLGPRR